MESSDSHSGLISSPCSPLAAIRCTSLASASHFSGGARRDARWSTFHAKQSAASVESACASRRPSAATRAARRPVPGLIVVVFGGRDLRRRCARRDLARNRARRGGEEAEAGEYRERHHEEESRAAAHLRGARKEKNLCGRATRESAPRDAAPRCSSCACAPQFCDPAAAQLASRARSPPSS